MNNKINQIRLNRRSYISLARTATLVALCSVGSFALAQVAPRSPVARSPVAVMLDGRVLTPKVPLSLFATEGPIWNLDLAN